MIRNTMAHAQIDNTNIAQVESNGNDNEHEIIKILRLMDVL